MQSWRIPVFFAVLSCFIVVAYLLYVRNEERRVDVITDAASSRTEEALSQANHPPQFKTDDHRAALKQAVRRISDAADPFVAARGERELLRRKPDQTLSAARSAWNLKSYWVACALIGEVRESLSVAPTWLPAHKDRESMSDVYGPDRDASSVLAHWFVDSDDAEALRGLFFLLGQYDNKIQQPSVRVIRRMASEGAPVVAWLGSRFQAEDNYHVIGIIKDLGPECSALAPPIALRLDLLARDPELFGRPQFGTEHGDDRFVRDAIEILPHLGEKGLTQCARFLCSSNRDVSGIVRDRILGFDLAQDERSVKDRFNVAMLLREAEARSRTSLHGPFFETVLTLGPTSEEWIVFSRIVSSQSDESRHELVYPLNQLRLDTVHHEHVAALIGPWHGHGRYAAGKEDAEYLLEALANAAPSAGLTNEWFAKILKRGNDDERESLLSGMARRFSEFSEEVREDSLALTTSPSPNVRAMVFQALATDGKAVANKRALALIRRGLADTEDDVILFALNAMATRGKDAASLTSLAVSAAIGGSAYTKRALLFALGKVGAPKSTIVREIRRVWTEAAGTPKSFDCDTAVVDFLTKYYYPKHFEDASSAMNDLLATVGLSKGHIVEMQGVRDRFE